jgi:acetyl-CoA carboxylase carboxyl transferase subunit alpha
MHFLEFEKPIQELHEELQRLKGIHAKGKTDLSTAIKELEDQLIAERNALYGKLSGWQRVQVSRHPDRPYTLFYAENTCTDFLEIYGDRSFRDDKAIVGGFARLDGKTVMIIGHQKGINTKMRQYRNFGMANPEGYRKALRLMKMAEKFGKPIITFIDTPGAFPGLEAEERGQAEAIARNIQEMMRLKVPVICLIVGEGASGGAIGIGVGNKVFMLENTWYSVISPESCSSILWRSWDHKEQAAEALQLTAEKMLAHGLIDGIIPEPAGGAHNDPKGMADILRQHLISALAGFDGWTPEQLVADRIKKFSSMGVFQSVQ